MQTEKTRWSCAAFILAFLVLFPLSADAASWLDEADVSWYKEGQSRFVISTETQLAGLIKLTGEGNGFKDKTIILSGDLNLEGKEWTPIGTEANPFRGTFDGRGHLIGLNAPLFNFAKAAAICGVNLSGDILIRDGNGFQLSSLVNNCTDTTIRDCSFTGSLVADSSLEEEVYLGGLVGIYRGEGSEVSGCRVRARLVAESVGDVFMGGVVGWTNGLIRNCSFEGEFHREGDVRDFIFCLGGIASEAGTVQACRARFSVSFSGKTGETMYIGGIAYFGMSLENCLAEWTVSEDRLLNVGGIVYKAEEIVKNCVFSGDVVIGSDGNIGGILGGSEDYNPFVSNCFVRGRLSGGATIGGVAGVNAGEIEDCSAVCEVLPGTGAMAGALVGDNQGTVSGCGWVSGLGPDNAVGNGEEPEDSGAVVSESALPVTSVVLTPFLRMLEGETEIVAAEVYPETSDKSAVSFSWTAEGAVLNIASPNAETTEIKALKKGTDDLKLSCGGFPGEEPLTPVISVMVRGLLPDSVSPDVPGPGPGPVSPDVPGPGPGPVSPDVPGPGPGPVSPGLGWLDSADVSWYDEGKSEFTLISEAQFAGLAKLTLDGKSFKDKTVWLGADLNLGSREWVAVGAFEGVFDGRNHTIVLGTGNTTALFSELLRKGILKNLHLSGTVDLAPKGASPAMPRGFHWADGTLLGVNRGIVEHCSFKGRVRYVGSEGVLVRALGGLVGCNPQRSLGEPSSIIRGCRVSGALEMAPEVGSASPGVPSLFQVLIGGIAGINLGDIEDSVFEGTLNRTKGGGSIVAGGIAGGLDGCADQLPGGRYSNCFASFDMKSSVPMQEAAMMTAMETPDTTCLGGIVGRLYGQTEIKNCRARAELEYRCGIDNVCAGGILGFGPAEIINGVFEGNITIAGTPKASLTSGSLRAYGGIVGFGRGLICNSFAKGTVMGSDGAVGGIVGYTFGKVENCSAVCNVSSEGVNANVGALVGNNQYAQDAVSNCRWVSGLGADKAIGAGDKLVSTDVVASESALPATSVAMIPLIGLTENKTASVKAEVYPMDAFNRGTVFLNILPIEGNILKVESDNAGMAVIRGVKEGASGLKLFCNGLLGDTTYNPTSLVMVKRVRLESLTLNPKVVELARKDQSAEIHMAIVPDTSTVSYLPKWTFNVLEGASAEADDIELTPAANGLGATVTLSRPVSGAKYRVLAEAVDGSGLSDDVIVTVKYVSPVPVSPDVSPDIPAPLSPDVPAPVSPDIEVPEVPEKGVAPRLPDKAPAGVGSSKPEFFGGKESAALKSAADALSDSGLTERNLTFDADTGVVRLQSRVVREVAGKVLPSGSTLKRVRTLPVLSAVLPQGANVAAVGLELTGTELLSKKASEVKLLKATGPDTGALLNWASNPEDFGDGCFTVLDSGGRVVEELKPRVRYVLTVFIKDGGKYDLDGEVNGRVVDPLALLSVTGGSEPGPSPQPEPEGRDSGGGCDAGFLWSWLLLLAAVPVAGRRRG